MTKELLETLKGLEKFESAVKGDISALRVAFAPSRIPVAIQSRALEQAPEDRKKIADLLERGIELVKQRKEKTDDDSLTDDEKLALTMLYLVYGRPAIPIRNDQFMRPPLGWELLEGYRDMLEDALLSVGRIEQHKQENVRIMGTGSLVGRNLIMTARHVVEHMLPRNSPDIVNGQSLVEHDVWIDWRAESERDGAQAQCRIVKLIWHHEKYDVAILQIDPSSAASPSAAKASALMLRGTAPRTKLDEVNCALIGYPLRDGEGSLTAEEIAKIIPGVLGTKRLQPGKFGRPYLLGHGNLAHDCSTLGGNSGSPIFLLHHGVPVIAGIHCSGKAGTKNQGVPSWTLRSVLPPELLASSDGSGLRFAEELWP